LGTTRPNDEVELRAVRDGNSVVMQLTRVTAEAKKLELESEGWTVEIREAGARECDVAQPGDRQGTANAEFPRDAPAV
jgi:hypothetical protein